MFTNYSKKQIKIKIKWTWNYLSYVRVHAAMIKDVNIHIYVCCLHKKKNKKKVYLIYLGVFCITSGTALEWGLTVQSCAFKMRVNSPELIVSSYLISPWIEWQSSSVYCRRTQALFFCSRVAYYYVLLTCWYDLSHPFISPQ